MNSSGNFALGVMPASLLSINATLMAPGEWPALNSSGVRTSTIVQPSSFIIAAASVGCTRRAAAAAAAMLRRGWCCCCGRWWGAPMLLMKMKCGKERCLLVCEERKLFD